MIGFMIDERPHVFVEDGEANRRFLETVDGGYWTYLAGAHAQELESAVAEDRQHAATALRVAYSQALETLFALIAAIVQCPKYPLAWLSRYRNEDLRSVVAKIHRREPFPSALRARPSWYTIAEAVYQFVPETHRSELSQRFGALWRHLAHQFLSEYFEPEYNSLKHGMRTHIGGFSVAAGVQRTPGQPAPPEDIKSIGSSEYGSTFWMPARKLEGYSFTFELAKIVSCAWVPRQFVFALPLIGMSIANVVGRAEILSGVDPTTVRFVWPSEIAAFDAPWSQRPSITHISFGETTNVRGWREPSAEDILWSYEANAQPQIAEQDDKDAIDDFEEDWD